MNLFELFVKIGVKDEASKNIGNISEKLGNGLKTAAKIGTAAVATVTAAVGTMTAAFVKGASEVAQYGDNIDKMSQKMGLSAEAYQEWDFIMQHSGTSMETLKASMKTLANAVDSGNDAFRRLGISQNEIASLNQEELFARTIEELQNVEDTTERTYLAGQLLGRGATELGALLNTSAEDTEAMRKQVHELGGVMSNEAVKAAAAYQDSLQNMQTAFSGIQRGMLSEFLPSMVTVMDGLALIFSGNDSGIAKITEGVNQFADKLMEAVPKISELGEGLLSSLTTAILDNLPTLTSTASSVIVKLVSGITSATPLLAQSAIDIIESLVDGLTGDNLEQIISSAISLIETLANGILNMLPEIVKLGLDLIVSLATGLSDSLPELMPTVVSVILEIVRILTAPENLSKLLEAALEIIVELAYGLMDAIPQLVDACFTIIENLVDFLIDPTNISMLLKAALDIIIAIGTGLVSSIPRLIEYWNKVPKSIIDNFKSTDWGKLGKDLVAGFKKGIQSAWGNLKKWFTGLFGDLTAIAKKILGIASPSKVFKKIGGFTIEGLDEGLEENAEDPIRTIEDISSQLTSAFDPSLSADYITTYDGYGSSAYGGSSSAYSSEESASSVNITFGEKAFYIANFNGNSESEVDNFVDAVIDKLTSKIQSREAVFA